MALIVPLLAESRRAQDDLLALPEEMDRQHSVICHQTRGGDFFIRAWRDPEGEHCSVVTCQSATDQIAYHEVERFESYVGYNGRRQQVFWLGDEERLTIGESMEVAYINERGAVTELLPIQTDESRERIRSVFGRGVLRIA